MKLKVMTYNIMSGKDFVELKKGKDWNDPSIIKPELVAEVIKKYNPDIVGLNEVRGKSFDFGFNEQIEQLAEYANYPYYYFAPAIEVQGGLYGNGILSKYPIKDAETVMIPDSGEIVENISESRSIAHVTIDCGTKVDVLVSHFGLLDSEQVEAVKAVRDIVTKAEKPCILMGDFNCRPDSVHIGALSELLKDTAPKDANESFYTHSALEPDKKIDYIFVSEDFTIHSAEALTDVASDHRPYITQIEI